MASTTSYEGRHAELYDLFYAAKDYAGEARFVHECLVRHGDGASRRVVDLACGTGRHAIELERLQHQVVGIDHSESMLRAARTNAAAAGSRIELRQGDLGSLDVRDAPFDAVTCLFDSIGYVRTNEGLERAFQGIRRSLRPGGLLVFEFWHAAAMLRSHDPVRVRRWPVAGGEVVRVSETELDCERQLASVSYTVYEHRADGTFTTFRETQTNRYFLVQEMAHWLTSSGLTPLAWYDGFSFERRVSPETWHVVAVARRDDGSA
jgi:SAM-dependent methyltransferase